MARLCADSEFRSTGWRGRSYGRQYRWRLWILKLHATISWMRSVMNIFRLCGVIRSFGRNELLCIHRRGRKSGHFCKFGRIGSVERRKDGTRVCSVTDSGPQRTYHAFAGVEIIHRRRGATVLNSFGWIVVPGRRERGGVSLTHDVGWCQLVHEMRYKKHARNGSGQECVMDKELMEGAAGRPYLLIVRIA